MAGAAERTGSLPLTRIRPPSRWTALDLGELVRFRELGYRLVRRDVTLRYRQTLLGVAWVFLQPLLAAGAFTLIFGRIARLPAPDGVPYFLLALWGSTGYTAFNSCLTKASNALVANGPLVSKVYFPRLLLPLSTVGASLLDAVVASGLGLGLGLVQGVAPGWALLTLPLWLLAALLLGLAAGLLFAPFLLRYRDVAYILPLLTQLLLYVSPVGYSLATVPGGLRTGYLLNPLAPVLEGVRWAALRGAAPPAWSVVYAVAALAALLLAGGLAFRRQERVFADVL